MRLDRSNIRRFDSGIRRSGNRRERNDKGRGVKRYRAGLPKWNPRGSQFCVLAPNRVRIDSSGLVRDHPPSDARCVDRR